MSDKKESLDYSTIERDITRKQNDADIVNSFQSGDLPRDASPVISSEMDSKPPNYVILLFLIDIKISWL